MKEGMKEALEARATELAGRCRTPLCVARKLEAAGIKGEAGNAIRCPLQQWFLQGVSHLLEDEESILVMPALGEQGAVAHPAEVVVFPPNGGPTLLAVPLPPVLEEFIAAMDDDLYPFLQS